MNVLMLSLMYPEDTKNQVARDVKDKLQNQINSYQRAFVEGIRANLEEDERLDIVNSLPVGIFPLQYRRAQIPAGWHDGHTIYELGCLNLPGIKQRGARPKGRAPAGRLVCAGWRQSRCADVHDVPALFAGRGAGPAPLSRSESLRDRDRSAQRAGPGIRQEGAAQAR